MHNMRKTGRFACGGQLFLAELRQGGKFICIKFFLFCLMKIRYLPPETERM